MLAFAFIFSSFAASPVVKRRKHSFKNPLAALDWRGESSRARLALTDEMPTPVIVSVTGHSGGKDSRAVLTLRQRVKQAALNWFMFSYSSFSNSTLKLLR